MGAKLCCMSLSTSDFDDEYSKSAIEPSNSMLSCIMIKPRCMKKEVEEEEEEKKKKAMKMRKLATLEEWLLSSPGMKPADRLSGGELHVLKQSSKINKVHPSSSSRVHAELVSTASPQDSMNISMEKIDEEDNYHGDGGRRGGKPAGRRVKFRRPEADVIIFYSPEGINEEIDKQSPKGLNK